MPSVIRFGPSQPVEHFTRPQALASVTIAPSAPVGYGNLRKLTVGYSSLRKVKAKAKITHSLTN